MNKSIMSFISAVFLVFLGTTDASANIIRYYPGSFCQPVSNAFYSGLLPSAIEASGNAAEAVCPAVTYVGSVSNVSRLDVYYINNSSTAISCYWQAQDGTGALYKSATRYSCTTGNGCASSGGTQSATPNNITWSSTAGGGTLLPGYAVPATFMGMDCHFVGTVESLTTIMGYATTTDN